MKYSIGIGFHESKQYIALKSYIEYNKCVHTFYFCCLAKKETSLHIVEFKIER